MSVGLATKGSALALHPHFLCSGICVQDFGWVLSSSLELRVVNKSLTLALACFNLLWFGRHLHFWDLSPISYLELAMMGLAFLSSNLYTNVDRCTPLSPNAKKL